MELVVVERHFETPVSAEEMRQMVRERGCNELYNVTIVRSYLAADGQRVICMYEAPDAESVRTTQRVNQIPHHAVWSSTLHTP